MTPWEILLVSYGLLISPIAGIRLVVWRVNGGIKSLGLMLLYLLVGLVNAAAAVFAIVLLPSGSWLMFWGMLIVAFYVGVYAYPKVNVNMD